MKSIPHKNFEILFFHPKPEKNISPYTPTPGEYHGYVFFGF